MRALLIVSIVILLGGCAFGRKYDYSAVPIVVPTPAVASTPLVLAVHDRRPYVVSGGKPERFVGLQRAGYGNPFDVNTRSGGPFADDVRAALAKSLKQKGYEITAVTLAPSDSQTAVRRKLTAAGGKKMVLVTLTEWKSDRLRNTDLHFDVTLAVLNEKGEPLASSSAQGKDSLGTAGVEGIHSNFARKFEALFEDEKVAAALR